MLPFRPNLGIVVAFEARDSDHQVREFIESQIAGRDMLATPGRVGEGSRKRLWREFVGTRPASSTRVSGTSSFAYVIT